MLWRTSTPYERAAWMCDNHRGGSVTQWWLSARTVPWAGRFLAHSRWMDWVIPNKLGDLKRLYSTKSVPGSEIKLHSKLHSQRHNVHLSHSVTISPQGVVWGGKRDRSEIYAHLTHTLLYGPNILCTGRLHVEPSNYQNLDETSLYRDCQWGISLRRLKDRSDTV